MANFFFQFKQFTVYQDQCAMKVGTDGVLLGAWSDVSACKNILDVGTGTGLISLMLAQRSPNADIVAIDIDEDCSIQAKQNIAQSLFANQINVQQISFQDFLNSTKRRFDLIVSNPPYFQNALKSPDISRNYARHDNTLSYKDIFATGDSLLSKKGRIALILPSDLKQKVIDDAARANLYPSRITHVFPLPHKPAKRILIEFVKSQTNIACKENMLVIETGRHHYSEEFKRLTKGFYLDK
ncbi:MAG: methyltransferase [Dysgonamonadaceae bacterium]